MINDNAWRDLQGLPVDAATEELVEQSPLSGARPALVSFAQNSVNQAVLACALERFRLTKGSYPGVLSELKTNYLTAIPVDVLNGRPMFYQQNGTNGFTLRGVGPDGILNLGTNSPGDDWLWISTPATNAIKRTVGPSLPVVPSPVPPPQ